MSPALVSPRYAHAWMRAWWIAGALALVGCQHTEDNDRFWVKAEIDHKPAKMIFDTGASTFFLNQTGAKRLGLEITEQPPDPYVVTNQLAVGRTAAYSFSLWGDTHAVRFLVVTSQKYLWESADGAVGWRPLRDKIFKFDSGTMQVTVLDAVPPEVETWQRFRVRRDASIMSLESLNETGPRIILNVDTGSTHGVELAPARWKEWRAAHTGQLYTLSTYYTPNPGLVVAEEMWAKEIELGPLVLHELPVMEENPGIVNAGAPGAVATLGVVALRQLDFIVDGMNNLAYLRVRPHSPIIYDYNRLGAVFVPSTGVGGDALVAQVAPGSPAAQVGIINGDILLQVGRYDVTDWQADPHGWPMNGWTRLPAGFDIDLKLKRGVKEYRVRPTLKNFLNQHEPLQWNVF